MLIVPVLVKDASEFEPTDISSVSQFETAIDPAFLNTRPLISNAPPFEAASIDPSLMKIVWALLTAENRLVVFPTTV